MPPSAISACLADRTSHFELLQRYEPRTIPTGESRQSAILIPFIAEKDQFVFTLRSDRLNRHAGQICFPGGSIEPGETPWEACLREANEEIGLPLGSVTFLGRLDDLHTRHGFHIRCYAGLVSPFVPELNPDEVDRLVPVHFDELLDRRLHATKTWKNHAGVHFFDFEHGEVWGITGLITYHLREILTGNRKT